MEIGDALGRIHHRHLGAVCMAGMQVIDDLFQLRTGQCPDFFINAGQAVVDVDAELVEHLAVLGESVLVKDLDGMAEDDRVRDFHHGRLDVQ